MNLLFYFDGVAPLVKALSDCFLGKVRCYDLALFLLNLHSCKNALWKYSIVCGKSIIIGTISWNIRYYYSSHCTFPQYHWDPLLFAGGNEVMRCLRQIKVSSVRASLDNFVFIASRYCILLTDLLMIRIQIIVNFSKTLWGLHLETVWCIINHASYILCSVFCILYLCCYKFPPPAVPLT